MNHWHNMPHVWMRYAETIYPCSTLGKPLEGLHAWWPQTYTNSQVGWVKSCRLDMDGRMWTVKHRQFSGLVAYHSIHASMTHSQRSQSPPVGFVLCTEQIFASPRKFTRHLLCVNPLSLCVNFHATGSIPLSVQRAFLTNQNCASHTCNHGWMHLKNSWVNETPCCKLTNSSVPLVELRILQAIFFTTCYKVWRPHQLGRKPLSFTRDLKFCGQNIQTKLWMKYRCQRSWNCGKSPKNNIWLGDAKSSFVQSRQILQRLGD